MIIDHIRNFAYKNGLDDSSLVSWVNYLEIPIITGIGCLLYLVLMLPLIGIDRVLSDRLGAGFIVCTISCIISLNPIDRILEKNDPKNVLISSVISYFVITAVYTGPIACIVIRLLHLKSSVVLSPFVSVLLTGAYCILYYVVLHFAKKEALGYAYWKNNTIKEKFNDFYSGRTKWRTSKVDLQTMQQNLSASGGRIYRCILGAMMSPLLCSCLVVAIDNPLI